MNNIEITDFCDYGEHYVLGKCTMLGDVFACVECRESVEKPVAKIAGLYALGSVITRIPTILAVVGAVVLSLVLAGCSTGSNDSEEDSGPDSSHSEIEDMNDDDKFMYILGEELSWIDEDSPTYPAFREDAIQGGKGVCFLLDDGMSISEVIEIGNEAGDPEMTGVVLGASIAVYCPRHGHLLD